jgi:general nucleoside transport system permease protein
VTATALEPAGADAPPVAADAERVTPPRRRYVVLGAVALLLGVGLVDLARRVPPEDITFTFGIPPDVPRLPLDPGGVVQLVGGLLVLGGLAGLLERRSGRAAPLLLGLAAVALVPLVLVLALAYSETKQTNAVPVLVESLRLATPIALGALAGLWCERSGVVNIGIEGMMLAAAGGGFVAYAVLGGAQGGPWLYGSVVLAVAIGGLMAALHAVLCVTFRTDQIISGVVLNLLALGLTSYLRTQVLVPIGIGSGRTLPVIALPVLSDLPVVGPVFTGQPIYFSTFVLLAATAVVLRRTRFGLRVRSVGENPHAAETLGVDPIRVRYAAVILGGLFAGLGGAWFSLEDVGSFQDGMTNGTGFIALAALIFGKWRPWPAYGGALLFGFTSSLETRLQLLDVRLEDVTFLLVPLPDTGIPSQFLQALPFVVTIIVLAGAIGRAVAPAAVGQPFERSR